MPPMMVTVDAYIADQRASGRIASELTAAHYRRTLQLHAEDCENRDVKFIGRDQVRTTLRRWEHPNTQRKNHSILSSFYAWCVEEGIRSSSPAAQIRRAKATPTQTSAVTWSEASRMLETAWPDRRRRWTIAILMYAGVRNAELRELTGADFRRKGYIRIRLGKGGKSALIPYLPQLEPIAAQIRTLVGDREYVIPSRYCHVPPHLGGPLFKEKPRVKCGSASLTRTVNTVAAEADLPSDIGPHALRRAFGTYVEREHGLVVAQTLLRHESVETTRRHYVADIELEELADILNHRQSRRDSQSRDGSTKAPTGFEPVYTALQAAA